MNVFECPFSLHARKSPKEWALVSREKKWNYLDCEMFIEGCASVLKKEGVKPGDSVALIPSIAFLTPLIFFALFRIGAIACPINTHYPLETLSEQLDELRAPFILHSDEEDLPKLKQIKILFSKLAVKGRKRGQSFLNKTALSTYLFTSGTTSKPKIACHTLGNHYYSALGSNAYLPVKRGDLYQISLPLYHIAGITLLFRTFMGGGSVALSKEIEGITHTSMVPTQLFRLLKEESLPKYRHILLGGAGISPSLYYKAAGRGLTVHPTYGMTEMSSQIATHFGDGSFSLGHPPSLPRDENIQLGRNLGKRKNSFSRISSRRRFSLSSSK